MSKTTKKKEILNPLIVERLFEKYGVSQRFITMSMNGTRTSETSKSVKKDYEEMHMAVVDLLKTL